MKLSWLTDIHLNFLNAKDRAIFYDTIIAAQSDAVLITGDIAEASSISKITEEIFNHIKQPIYFVLGNHDFYRGKIAKVKDEMRRLTASEKQIFWLPAAGPQCLEKNTVLLGQDGWADARYGDYAKSPVTLNDSHMIADLVTPSVEGRGALQKKMEALADEDANNLHDELEAAIDLHHPEKMIILTHVPPFKEASLYEGKISGDDFLPFFSSKATGDVLLKIAKKNSAIEFLVLCGHTHSEANYQPLDNLEVQVGKAEYYQPIIQEVLVI